MSSNLSRLFTYAKASKNDARENFTTEALAAAIRHDPAPMIELLADVQAISQKEKPIDVFTQRSVPGAGIIDLVLLFDALKSGSK